MFNPYNMTYPLKSMAQPKPTFSYWSSREENASASSSKHNHEAAKSTTELPNSNNSKTVSSIMVENRRLSGAPVEGKYTKDEVTTAVRMSKKNRKGEERLREQQRKESLAKMQADAGLTRYFFSVFPDGAPIPGIAALEACVYQIRKSEGREADAEITEAEVARALELFADQVKWHNASLTPVGTVNEECVKGCTADMLAMRLEGRRLRQELVLTKDEEKQAALRKRISALVEKRVDARIEKLRAQPDNGTGTSESGVVKRASDRPASWWAQPKTRPWDTKPMFWDAGEFKAARDRFKERRKVVLDPELPGAREAQAAWDRIDARMDARIKSQSEADAKKSAEKSEPVKRSVKNETLGAMEELMATATGQQKNDRRAESKANSGTRDSDQWSWQCTIYPPPSDAIRPVPETMNQLMMDAMPLEKSTRKTDLKGKGKANDCYDAQRLAGWMEDNLQMLEDTRQGAMEEGSERAYDGPSDMACGEHWTHPEQEPQWERKQHWAESAAQMDETLQKMERRREKLESETVASKKAKTDEAESKSNSPSDLLPESVKAGFEKWKSENVRPVQRSKGVITEEFKAPRINVEVDQTNTSDGKAAGKKKADIPYLPNSPMTYAPRRQVFPTSNVLRNEDRETQDDSPCTLWDSYERQRSRSKAAASVIQQLTSSVSVLKQADEKTESDWPKAMSALSPEVVESSSAEQLASSWMHQNWTPAVTSNSRPQVEVEAFNEVREILAPEAPGQEKKDGQTRDTLSMQPGPLCYYNFTYEPCSDCPSCSTQTQADNQARDAVERQQEEQTAEFRRRMEQSKKDFGQGNKDVWAADETLTCLGVYRPLLQHSSMSVARPAPTSEMPSNATSPALAQTEKASETDRRPSPAPAPKPDFDFETAYKQLSALFQNFHISTAATVRALNEDLQRATASVDRMIQKMADTDSVSSDSSQEAAAPSGNTQDALQSSLETSQWPTDADWLNSLPKEAAEGVTETGDEVEQCTQEIGQVETDCDYCGEDVHCDWFESPYDGPPPLVSDDDACDCCESDDDGPPSLVSDEDACDCCASDDDEPPLLVSDEDMFQFDQDIPVLMQDVDDVRQHSEEDEAESSEESDSSKEDDEESSEDKDEPEGDAPEEDNQSESAPQENESSVDHETEECEPLLKYQASVEDAPEEGDDPSEPQPEEDEPSEQGRPSERPSTPCQCANASWARIGGYEDEADDGERMVCACTESAGPCYGERLSDGCYCAACELYRELGAEVSTEVAMSDASSVTLGEAAEIETSAEEDFCIVLDEDRYAEEDDGYNWVDDDDLA